MYCFYPFEHTVHKIIYILQSSISIQNVDYQENIEHN